MRSLPVLGTASIVVAVLARSSSPALAQPLPVGPDVGKPLYLFGVPLKQGGYDWGLLAYAVGFGGSMIWFGSSAGVAISNMYPEARSVGRWLRHGWFVAISYVVGFFVMFAILGWNPDPPHKKRVGLETNTAVYTVAGGK